MDTLPLDVLSRWIHVGTAIVVLGGSFFLRVVLLPAMAGLPDTEATLGAGLRQRIMATWKKIVITGIALFLISGLYNYLVVALPRHQGDGLYHALMGTKILLALVIFFLASALVGRTKALEPIRRNNRTWLAVILLLGLTIVCISGYLKIARPGTPAGEMQELEARS